MLMSNLPVSPSPRPFLGLEDVLFPAFLNEENYTEHVQNLYGRFIESAKKNGVSLAVPSLKTLRFLTTTLNLTGQQGELIGQQDKSPDPHRVFMAIQLAAYVAYEAVCLYRDKGQENRLASEFAALAQHGCNNIEALFAKLEEDNTDASDPAEIARALVNRVTLRYSALTRLWDARFGTATLRDEFVGGCEELARRNPELFANIFINIVPNDSPDVKDFLGKIFQRLVMDESVMPVGEALKANAVLLQFIPYFEKMARNNLVYLSARMAADYDKPAVKKNYDEILAECKNPDVNSEILQIVKNALTLRAICPSLPPKPPIPGPYIPAAHLH